MASRGLGLIQELRLSTLAALLSFFTDLLRVHAVDRSREGCCARSSHRYLAALALPSTTPWRH